MQRIRTCWPHMTGRKSQQPSHVHRWTCRRNSSKDCSYQSNGNRSMHSVFWSCTSHLKRDARKYLFPLLQKKPKREMKPALISTHRSLMYPLFGSSSPASTKSSEEKTNSSRQHKSFIKPKQIFTLVFPWTAPSDQSARWLIWSHISYWTYHADRFCVLSPALWWTLNRTMNKTAHHRLPLTCRTPNNQITCQLQECFSLSGRVEFSLRIYVDYSMTDVCCTEATPTQPTFGGNPTKQHWPSFRRWTKFWQIWKWMWYSDRFRCTRIAKMTVHTILVHVVSSKTEGKRSRASE